MSDQELTYCSGFGCQLKDDCLRYRKDLNKKVHLHFDYPPYDATKHICSHQLFKDGRNLSNSLDAYLNKIFSENGKQKDDRSA